MDSKINIIQCIDFPFHQENSIIFTIINILPILNEYKMSRTHDMEFSLHFLLQLISTLEIQNKTKKQARKKI